MPIPAFKRNHKNKSADKKINIWNITRNGILFPKLFRPTRTIYSNSGRAVQFLKQNAFLTCYWMFLRLEKNGI